jgi:hypothetical protein
MIKDTIAAIIDPACEAEFRTSDSIFKQLTTLRLSSRHCERSEAIHSFFAR